MNPPPSPSLSSPNLTGGTPVLHAETALLTTRPPFILSLLRLLMAVGAGVSILLGVAAYADFLPAEWAVYVGAATALLIPLREGIIGMGDLLDDGVKNNSFKLGLMACLLLPAFLLSACTTAGMSQKQLSLAGAGYAVAEIGLAVAEATLQEKLADPKTPAWQVLSAKLAFSQAKKAVDSEQAKLDAAFAAMLRGDVPPDLAMPAYTGDKVPVYVIP